MKTFFGLDKHCKAIYDGSIIKFLNLRDKKRKIGHLWLHKDGTWVISYNHLWSEVSDRLQSNAALQVRNIRVIGFGESDQDLLKEYREN